MSSSTQATMSIDTFETPWGWLAFAASDCGLLHSVFAYETEQEAMKALQKELKGQPVNQHPLPEWKQVFADFFAGKEVDMTQCEFDTKNWTSFRKRVYEASQNIPKGKTVSYLELAQKIGKPKAARAVGQALAHNPVPPLVPCHRIISSAGKLTGFSAAQGIALKKKLLDWEQDQS